MMYQMVQYIAYMQVFLIWSKQDILCGYNLSLFPRLSASIMLTLQKTTNTKPLADSIVAINDDEYQLIN